MKSKIIIGTRPSNLALWQANHVKSLLEEKHPELQIELKKITTKGDRILDRSLMEIGGKGLFLKEIEDQLLAGSIDMAVHSMKDVPYEMPAGLKIAAILERADHGDSWLSRENLAIDQMPENSVVGTTSLRRKYQILKRYPNFQVKNLRGNVETRIRKMKEGEFDGIVLATAGLKRLKLDQEIVHELDIVSAVGQGAVGVEIRAEDENLNQLLQSLHDENSSRCVQLERYFLKQVQGSCSTPLGAHVIASQDQPNHFAMRVFLAKPDGSHDFETSFSGEWKDGENLVDAAIKTYQNGNT